MRVHAIQTGTVMVKRRQRAGVGASAPLRLFNTIRDSEWTPPLPIYAWLIEHDEEGLILVDTGETARTAEPGYFPRWHPYYRYAVRSEVRRSDEVDVQLRERGVEPADVRRVVLTHLHTDHAGGLYHFPKSEIYVSARELDVASGVAGRARGYLNQHWPSWFAPTRVDFGAEPLGPFPHTWPLTTNGDVLLIATPGHTPGHLSVLVEDDHGIVFLAGDTSYTEELMVAEVIDGVAPAVTSARQTLERIKSFTTRHPTVYLPSHDPQSSERLDQRRLVGERPSESQITAPMA
jgi:glyoxylase-like metal-dependent hydrolase (beta-lactamase superfamily II)